MIEVSSDSKAKIWANSLVTLLLAIRLMTELVSCKASASRSVTEELATAVSAGATRLIEDWLLTAGGKKSVTAKIVKILARKPILRSEMLLFLTFTCWAAFVYL